MRKAKTSKPEPKKLEPGTAKPGKSKPGKTKAKKKTARAPRAEFPWWEQEWWVSWVFLTLAHNAWNGSTYETVQIDRKFIGIADAINEAIPMAEEVEDSVNKLAALGLLEAQGPNLQLTEAGRQLFEKILKQRRSIRNQFEPATRYLMKCSPLETAPPRWHLSQDQYTAVLKDYHDFTKEILKNLR